MNLNLIVLNSPEFNWKWILLNGIRLNELEYFVCNLLLTSPFCLYLFQLLAFTIYCVHCISSTITFRKWKISLKWESISNLFDYNNFVLNINICILLTHFFFIYWMTYDKSLTCCAKLHKYKAFYQTYIYVSDISDSLGTTAHFLFAYFMLLMSLYQI